ENAALDDEGASEESDDLVDDDADVDDVDDADGDGDAEAERTRAADRFWTSVRIDPIEIALPSGVGYTLRAYRQNTDVTPADVSGREDEVSMPRQVETVELDEDEFDEDDLAKQAGAELAEDEDFDEAEEAEEDEDEEAAEEVVEEVPVFLSQGGH